MYEPWYIVKDIRALGTDNVMVAVPWVAAADEESVAVTASITAKLTCIKASNAISQIQNQIQIENLRSIVFEPPLVRFSCPVCKDVWDAWVADDGSLEDKWSCVCTNADCSGRGVPANIVYCERPSD